MKDFKDKVVWITGASSGIGEALSYALAAAGAKLILSARRKEELERVAKNCQEAAEIMILPLDLAQADSLPEKVSQALAHFGYVDLLINNGGISQRSLAKETSLEVYRKLMEVNYFGTIALTQALLPSMLERKSGHLAVVSSIAGKVGAPLRTGYSASKFAVNGYFEALRVETMKDNLKVSIICPGFIKTNVSVNALTADGSAQGKTDENINEGMTAEACAAQIVEGLREEKMEILVGGEMEVAAVALRFHNPEQLNQMLVTLLDSYKVV